MTLAKTIAKAAAGLAALALAASPAFAQTFSPGTYMVQGGSYSITVRQENGDLVVDEPNKPGSHYAPQGDGSFQFRNPTNGILYGLRVVDDHTIEAFKPDAGGGAPTVLVRMGGAPAAGAPRPDDRFAVLAEKYAGLIGSDPANVQSWTACAGVAMKRSVSNDAEADAYARQMADMLKQMNAASSPCPEVIPASAW